MEYYNTFITWQGLFEIIATISGIICVYLQTKEKVAAWIFGIISVVLLAFIFFDSNLLSDFFLHLILLGLNIYGWYNWVNKKGLQKEKAPVLHFKNKDWAFWILVIAIATPIWGFGMANIFNADLAYFDAFTTVGSLVAQYLLAKKYLENWIVWIIVDVIAIGVYAYKGLYFVTFLFFVYLLLCILGYRKWKNEPVEKIPNDKLLDDMI